MSGQPDPGDVLQVVTAILKSIEAGEITAETRKEQGMVRQLRGAIATLEALTAPRTSDRADDLK